MESKLDLDIMATNFESYLEGKGLCLTHDILGEFLEGPSENRPFFKRKACLENGANIEYSVNNLKVPNTPSTRVESFLSLPQTYEQVRLTHAPGYSQSPLTLNLMELRKGEDLDFPNNPVDRDSIDVYSMFDYNPFFHTIHEELHGKPYDPNLMIDAVKRFVIRSSE